MKIVSLFSGCGGLDLGFKQAGFDIIWANEFDKSICPTFIGAFKNTVLDTRSITNIDLSEIPNSDGIVGGPPCQSWSEFGAKRGIKDKRGQLFLKYVEIINNKLPRFFLAENVSGILFKRHKNALEEIRGKLSKHYKVSYELLNTSEFGVPQDRERVIFIGYRKDLGKKFQFSTVRRSVKKLVLNDVIWDLRKSAVSAITIWTIRKNSKGSVETIVRKNQTNPLLIIPNHEYFEGTYSPHYMSRNRVRGWDECSFTIQAGARHAPIHPQASKMIKIGKDKFQFDGDISLYRRLSVRECARIQTFPDNFIFIYDDVTCGYKMVGNAVPVNFARVLAEAIIEDIG